MTEQEAWAIMQNENIPGDVTIGGSRKYELMLTHPNRDESWIIKVGGIIGNVKTFKKYLRETWGK